MRLQARGAFVHALNFRSCSVAQVFDFMVTTPIREGLLVEVLPSWAAAGPPIHAVALPERARTPNARAFMDFAVEALHGGTGPLRTGTAR